MPELEHYAGSWIAVRRATGEVIGEFFNKREVEKFNPKTVKVMTAAAYLAGLNKRAENPVPASRLAGNKRADLDAAADLFRRFTGHEPHQKARHVAEDRGAFLRVGTVDGILYTTNRNQAGKAEVEQYIHHFNPASRPELLVSGDGKVARTHGGKFTFTERGFVDEDATGEPIE